MELRALYSDLRDYSLSVVLEMCLTANLSTQIYSKGA
jgi:hypothetical protein